MLLDLRQNRQPGVVRVDVGDLPPVPMPPKSPSSPLTRRLTNGLPLALYGDRLNILVRNDAHWTLEEQLRGAQDPTHFGRMLRDLGIGYVPRRLAPGGSRPGSD